MSLRVILLFFLLFLSMPSFSQFWFGVKSGAQWTTQIYQERGYTDTFDPRNIINWHVGGVVNYTTSEKYSVHTELLYERAKRVVRQPPDSVFRSEFVYHFLTAPVMFRVQFGRTPIRYYINAGPQFRFWVTGKGSIRADELFENDVTGTRKVKVRFKDPSEDSSDNLYFVPNPNRIQYAFLIGGGLAFDLFNRSQRLMIDGRFSWGHSIMAFNRGTESSQLASYGENFEFTDNTITISAAYLFGFNPVDVRKGGSTIKKKNMK